MQKAQKIEAVKLLKEKIGKSKALFLTDYKGITHKQLEGLRKALKKVEAEYVVAKNTLLSRALTENNSDLAKQLASTLQNPTAILLAYGDEIAAVKELAAFIKSTQLPKIKMGVFDGAIATESDFTKLASLPTKHVLLATLVNRLQSPISGFHYALRWNLQKVVTVFDNIKSKKPVN